MEREERTCYEKRRKSRANYNGYVDVYHYNHSNYNACYDGITSDGREIKIPCLFSFTHYVMNALRHHVKHVRHAPKLYMHLTL